MATLHALLDAGALATSGRPSGEHRALAPLAALLDGLATELGRERGGAAALVDAIADALDVEIARWEARAREDADARPVLRAFLGVRELLWELGVRRGGGGNGGGDGDARGGRRVQRVPVEG